MRIVLRGRRSCLLWVLTFVCVIGISVSALTVTFARPISSALQTTSFTTQAAMVAQVVRSYRDGERAALLTLDPDVLAQLPVFAQGEALDDVQQRVRALDAAGVYQKVQIDAFTVERVAQEAPYVYVTTHEEVTLATYAQTSGDATPVEQKHASLQVVYQLVHDKERWKVAKAIVAEH